MASRHDDDDMEEEEGGSNINPLEIGLFVLQAARRHWLLGLIPAVIIVALGVGVAAVLPKTYEARTKVFVADPNQVNPIRGDTGTGSALVGIVDKVVRGENLRAIVKSANLISKYEANRSPVLKLKDSIRGSLLDQPEEQQVRSLAGTLSSRLNVWVEGQSIYFNAVWDDPESAAKIANIARERFLDERLREQVSVLTTATELLQKKEQGAAKEIEDSLEAVNQAKADALKQLQPEHPKAGEESAGKPTYVYRRVATNKDAAEPDPQLTEKLAGIRANIREAQNNWERTQLDLQRELKDMRTVYGPKHPAVQQQERRIEAASARPAALTRLQEEEKQLLASIQANTVMAQVAPEEHLVRMRTGGASATPTSPEVPDIDADELQSAQISKTRASLSRAITNYAALAGRLDEMRSELMTAKTAFQYRYQVLEVADPPTAPMNGKRPLFVVLGALAFALLVGILVGPIKELATGRVLEVWQVRQLGLPVLGEINAPKELPARTG